MVHSGIWLFLYIDFLGNPGLFKTQNPSRRCPTWFTHNITLIVLGLLSLLEIVATKNADAREILNTIDKYLKTALALLTYAGVVSAVDAEFTTTALKESAVPEGVFGIVVAGLVFFASKVRAQLIATLFEADEDDESGIQSVLSWLEDFWAIAGLVMLFLFPIVMVVLIIMFTGMLLLVRRYIARRAEQSKLPCSNCGEPTYPVALSCGKCETNVDSPCEIGFLGQTKKTVVTDRLVHQLRLVEQKRCPQCATRFQQRDATATCSECGSPPFSDQESVEQYTAMVSKRVPMVCAVILGMGLVPILGLISGVIYYRLMLVAPYKRYMPLGRRFLLKWGLRLLCFMLIAFQWVPVLGAIVLPIMAFASHIAYRSTFRDLEIAAARESTTQTSDPS